MRFVIPSLVLCMLLAPAAHAVPILSATYVNNDQVFNPLDQVTIQVRVVNSGDTAAVDFPGRGVSTSNWVSEYSWTFPSVPGVYAAGSSTIIDLIRLSPTGPAPEGSYFSSFTSLSFAGSPVLNLGSFNWTVSSVRVPEPGTLLLLLGGLAGLGLVRRRRQSA
jgi:hypothetical protein